MREEGDAERQRLAEADHGGMARRRWGPYLSERQWGTVRGGFDWRDLVLFYEYFHGDNGAGIGASHQTGWTGLVAVLPLLFRSITAEMLRNQVIEMPV